MTAHNGIMTTRRNIDFRAAHVCVEAAVTHGLRIGVPVAAAVVDGSARLTAFLRSGGAFVRSTDIAVNKAETAAGFRLETGALYGMVKGNAAVLEGLRSLPGAALFGGGVPITFANEVIGAIGVSGGSEDQDIECARVGIVAIEALLAGKSQDLGNERGPADE
jgi:uncharacterized protein GlcG (DUF336 family)